MAEDESLTIPEAARKFKISERTLRQAARRGNLRARKFGRDWMVTAEDVGQWIAHARHTPGRPRKRPTEDT